MSEERVEESYSDSGSENLAHWGLRFTWVYLIILVGGLPIAAYFGAINVKALDLNELGDFLAGAFGPLAIGWLVLGFFQQGNELRNSVDALNLQARELRNSVKQQKAMVGITKKQLNLDIEVRDEQNRINISKELPLISCKNLGYSSTSNAKNYKFALLNLGPDAIETNMTLKNQSIMKGTREFGFLANKDQTEFVIPVPRELFFGNTWETIMTVTSINIRGQERVQTFSLGNFAPKQLTCEPQNQ